MADFFFDRNENDASDTLGDVVDELGPFSIKTNKRAPISKGIALENFLAALENKLFQIERAYKTPRSNLPRTEYRALGELRPCSDIVVRMQDKDKDSL